MIIPLRWITSEKNTIKKTTLRHNSFFNWFKTNIRSKVPIKYREKSQKKYFLKRSDHYPILKGLSTNHCFFYQI